LQVQVAARLTAGHRRYTLSIDAADGAAMAWLHQHGDVIDSWTEEMTTHVEVRLAEQDYQRFLQRG
ncbi:hypothetical protein ABTL16_19275, partial [Acinetobacter baumannii]